MAKTQTYRFMTRAAVEKWKPVARRQGVSKVARSSRGFMAAYARAGYRASRLTEKWRRKRAAFIKRHMAQVRKRREPLWKDGKPTRRHLALMMWAYTPGRKARNPKGRRRGKREAFMGVRLPRLRAFVARHPRTGLWHGIDSVMRCPVTEGFRSKTRAEAAAREWEKVTRTQIRADISGQQGMSYTKADEFLNPRRRRYSGWDWGREDTEIVLDFLRRQDGIGAIKFVRTWLLRTGRSPDLQRAKQIVADIRAGKRWMLED